MLDTALGIEFAKMIKIILILKQLTMNWATLWLSFFVICLISFWFHIGRKLYFSGLLL